VYRSASLVGSGVPHPVLYAFDAFTMQRLWNSTTDQLHVGGKYNHAVVVHGVVLVGTDRIQAFGLSPASATQPVRINAGGPAVGSFRADTDFVGGHSDTFSNSIDLSGVTDPAPEPVYQSKRTDSASFTYTISALGPGAPYLVRLHFAENVWTAPGRRVFSVAINGTTVLDSFDIVQTAGSRFKAVVEEFQAVPDANGQISIQYVAGGAGNALANGLEIVPIMTTAVLSSAANR
jgi:malectin (di-glucose binding ER protein)